ncbi:MAG TPA: ATP-dependent metallopeptidase FtsH/Yme1/Tma family protein, partial [Steroidobacteraceae bacterium]|nr:ATP-dependent metallopeptidase FtsH/Yme1/Tma family protein [Steroidobacteraceae bacterium]
MADNSSRRSQDPRRPERKKSTAHPKRGVSNPDGSGPPPFRFGPLSWLILALLIIWNAWAFMPRKNVAVQLPYSEFVTQVASGNVTAIGIVGSAINGRFAHPLLWPERPA